MNRRFRCLLVALLVTMGYTPTHAQSWAYFDDYCRIGTMRTCGSIRVSNVWDPVALLTRVELWVRNLQGTHWNDNTLGSPITRVGLTAPRLRGASNLSVRTEGSVETAGTPGSFWSLTNLSIEGPVTFSTTSTAAPQGAIMGCDNVPGMPVSYFRTCDGQGHTGWVVFAFTTTNQWDIASAEIAWKIHTTTADGQHYYACRSEDDPDNRYDAQCAYSDPNPPATATPEPATMALLGSGLLGIAGLRRRKPRVESENSAAD